MNPPIRCAAFTWTVTEKRHSWHYVLEKCTKIHIIVFHLTIHIINSFYSFWVTVCKTVQPMLSDSCLSCLFVCLRRWCTVHGETVGWIKMNLGMQVGLGPGHIVLDWDPAPPPLKGQSPQFSAHICCCQMGARIKMSLRHCVKKGAEAPNFGPCLLWPNGRMGQDATWYGDRPRPGPHCARWGPISPSQNVDTASPIFGPCLLWSNGWMDQNATW